MVCGSCSISQGLTIQNSHNMMFYHLACEQNIKNHASSQGVMLMSMNDKFGKTCNKYIEHISNTQL
jgi:hypothetical protein